MSLKVEKINNRWYVNGEPSKTPRVDDLKKQFDELNEAYFGGALPPCRMFCTTSLNRLAAPYADLVKKRLCSIGIGGIYGQHH